MERMILTLLVFISAFAGFNAEATTLENVPFKSQSPPGDWANNMNCGPTSAVMVAGYYTSFTPTEQTVKSVLDWMYATRLITPQAEAEYYDGNSTNIRHLRSILRDFYLLPEAVAEGNRNWEFLKQTIDSGNPVIVAVTIQMNPAKKGHFMVVLGIEGDEVIVHDPGKTAGAFKRYPKQQLLASWATSGNAVVYVDRKSSAPTWHPDGTLIKLAAEPKVYLLIRGAAYWIENEAVFRSHSFDWNRIITVTPEELACYPYGGKIDWQPYRELFSVNGTIYMMEKQSASSGSCALYRFSSRKSYESWTLPGTVVPLTQNIANARYFLTCSDNGTLYARHGTLLKPDFPLVSYGSGVMFVMENEATIRPFESEAVFNALGYSRLPAMTLNQADFNASFRSFGQMIRVSDTTTCFSGNDAGDGGNNADTSDYDGDGISAAQGDCNDYDASVFPGAIETCDFQDNDCDGVIDECPDAEVCINGHCSVAEPELPPEEPVVPEEPEQPEPGPDLAAAEAFVDSAPSDRVVCAIACPAGYTAFAWYGISETETGQVAYINASEDQICERGNPWLDFNCACDEPELWACFDWMAAEVFCNRSANIGAGIVHPVGEGEIWFSDFVCYEEPVVPDEPEVIDQPEEPADAGQIIEPEETEPDAGVVQPDTSVQEPVQQTDAGNPQPDIQTVPTDPVDTGCPEPPETDTGNPEPDLQSPGEPDVYIEPQATPDAGVQPEPDIPEEPPVQPENLRCTVTCPADMTAYVWYGSFGASVGNPVDLDLPVRTVCERGRPWVDFNCACEFPYSWACYDWTVAEVQCNYPVSVIAGIVGAPGSGEIWVSRLNCSE